MCLRSSVHFTLKQCQKYIITIKSNAEEETILRVPEERCPRGTLRLYKICTMTVICETLVSTRAGDTEYFHVGVGLHQGSSLSPLPFIIIMDVLQAEIGKEPPWVMLFADDLVICEHSRAEIELQLERWRW